MRNCLVIGSGRSGTSMVAGILDKSGYNTGDDYLTPRDTNPSGFFEDETVNRVNDRIMRTVVKAPPGWDAVAKVKGGGRVVWPLLSRLPGYTVDTGLWLASPDREPWLPGDDVETVRKLVAAEPFAYKDPRFVHTLPAWRSHLPDGTVRVVVFREPSRTANSIAREMATHRYRHVHIGYERALRLWKTTYRRVLDLSRDGGRWVFVHFDQVLDGDDRLDETLEVDLDRSHVDPSLKRAPAEGDVPAGVEATYRELCELAGYPSP